MGNSNQLEEMAIKRALEYKAFYEEHGRKPSRGLQRITKEQQKHERILMVWFNNIKQAKYGKSSHILYLSIEKILIDLLGERWYENNNLEEIAIKKALDYKAFYEEYRRNPSKNLQIHTKEQRREKKLAFWFQNIKNAKKGISTSKVYPSVEKILIELLGQMWYNNLEDNAIKRALEYKTFYEEKKRTPLCVHQRTTKEQKYEYTLAIWYSKIKVSKKENKLYLSVENIMIQLLGDNWCDNLEDNAIKKALEYKNFYQENQRKPSVVLTRKTKEQKDSATEEQKHEHILAIWFYNIKRAKIKKDNKSMRLYPSVENILIECCGSKWFA